MHESSKARMQSFVDHHLADRRGVATKIADIGSSDVNGSYRSLFAEDQWSYVGADLEAGPGVDVVLATPYSWSELGSRSFDVVVSGQAFEHIEFPWVSMLEITRILRPGGLVCVIAPSSGGEHRYPRDCWRFYPDGMAALAAWADLDVVEHVTHWDDEPWPDDSNQWHDSVLVARRPLLGPLAAARAATKRRLLRSAMAVQAHRRDWSYRESAARSNTSV